MWIRVVSYKGKNGRVDRRRFSKVYDYFTKQYYLKSISEDLVKEIKVNINAKNLVEFWEQKFIDALRKRQGKRGRRPCRFAYQIMFNPGIGKEFQEEFEKFLFDFVDIYLKDKHSCIFIHKDSNFVHAHIMVHAVDVNGNILRMTKEEIKKIKELVENIYQKYNLENLRLVSKLQMEEKQKIKKVKEKELKMPLKNKKEVPQNVKLSRVLDTFSQFSWKNRAIKE